MHCQSLNKAVFKISLHTCVHTFYLAYKLYEYSLLEIVFRSFISGKATMKKQCTYEMNKVQRICKDDKVTFTLLKNIT